MLRETTEKRRRKAAPAGKSCRVRSFPPPLYPIPRFELGTLTNATRYINQFTEIFTEEGRKNVKITHKVPNQPPRVSYTPGMRASMTQQAAAANTNTSSGSGSGSPATAGTAILQKKPSVGSGAAQPAAQVGSLS